MYMVDGKAVRPLGQEGGKAYAILKSLDSTQLLTAILNYRVADLVLGPGQDGKVIAAYVANSLVPNDCSIRIGSQMRHSLQSHYELKYEQLLAGVRTVSMTTMLLWGPLIVGLQGIRYPIRGG